MSDSTPHRTPLEPHAGPELANDGAVFHPTKSTESIARGTETAGRRDTGVVHGWSAGITASLLLHAAAAAAILFSLARFAAPANPADAVMTVELAPTVSAPPSPPRLTPPGPQSVAAVAKPHPIDQPKVPPPPQVLVPVKPEIVLQTTPEPQPDRPVLKQAADQTTAPQALAAPPKPVAAAPAAGGSAVASDAPQTWESLLLAKLQRNKRYPAAAQAQDQEDVVYLRIAIDRTGRVIDANVVRSRGYAMLDAEVVALAHRASPFPAPPPNEQGDPVVVVVPVEFFVTHRRGG